MTEPLPNDDKQLRVMQYFCTARIEQKLAEQSKTGPAAATPPTGKLFSDFLYHWHLHRGATEAEARELATVEPMDWDESEPYDDGSEPGIEQRLAESKRRLGA